MSIKRLCEIVESPSAELGATVIDSLGAVPFGGLLVSIFKTGVGIANYCLFKKFASFLAPMSKMEGEVDMFLEKMTPLERDKLGEYILSLLSNAESSEKAQIMGMIFKSAVHREIDNEMMLRLVSIVGRSYVADLKELPKYLEASECFSVATNEFINLGLINNETGGLWKDRPTTELNEVGRTLYQILKKEGWFGCI